MGPMGMNDARSAARLRERFIAWQCRIRRQAVREYGGRPTPGMRPRVLLPDGREIAPAVTLVLVEAEPADSLALFRHIVGKTHDPETRYREALKVLSSAYYQNPGTFSDVMTALFAADSPTAAALAAAGRCVLEFGQFDRGYRVPCAVRAAAPDEPLHHATYWHNHLFNPAMPGAVRILAFTPDWRGAAEFAPG